MVESALEIPAISKVAISKLSRHAVVMGRDLYIHFGKHYWLLEAIPESKPVFVWILSKDP